MAEKIKNEIGMNKPAIDEDSSEVLVNDNKTKILKSHSTKRRNNQFSENIFFYSYPFPIRYIRKAILSPKKA
jgi:hypothetical protein